MKITIHRVNKIGGYITIIEHDGCKIIIDLGSNLPGSIRKNSPGRILTHQQQVLMLYSILITMVVIPVYTIWFVLKYHNI